MASPSLGALPGFNQNLVVGVGDLAVTNNPSAIIVTHALGSCLGITIYDPVLRVGGLLHLMLPDSSINPAKSAAQPAMFVDSGVAALFRAAYQMQASKYRMIICVAGGAQIMDHEGLFNIGLRNHAALVALLDQHGLKVHSTHVGGTVSRNLRLSVRTGEVRLKVAGQPDEILMCRGS